MATLHVCDTASDHVGTGQVAATWLVKLYVKNDRSTIVDVWNADTCDAHMEDTVSLACSITRDRRKLDQLVVKYREQTKDKATGPAPFYQIVLVRYNRVGEESAD